MMACRNAMTPPAVSSTPARTPAASASVTIASSAAATAVMRDGSKSPTTAPATSMFRWTGSSAPRRASTRSRIVAGTAATPPRQTMPPSSFSIVPSAHVREKHLLDQQRDAVAARNDVRHERVRRAGIEECGDEIADAALGQPDHGDDLDDAVTAERTEQLVSRCRFRRPHGADDAEAVDRRVGEVADEFEALRVGVVQIVEQQHRPIAGRRDLAHEPDHPFERQQPQLCGIELRCARGTGHSGSTRARPRSNGLIGRGAGGPAATTASRRLRR